MKIVLFGATGMVGQGVLREALQAPDVESVLTVGRTPTGQQHVKLQEIVHRDFKDFSGLEAQLSGYDACFFCLGASAAGMTEADYRRVTYDFALAAAKVLARVSPGMTFVYVSGTGTDGSEKGRSMWARVKGETENALQRLPFRAAYMFRPAFIQPAHGEVSKTPLYRAIYAATGWLFPVLRRVFPRHVTTTEQVGRAMLRVAREGAPQRVLENADIARLGGSATTSPAEATH
jgi:uncharacterized protein YbjT (DUF2867 family)